MYESFTGLCQCNDACLQDIYKVSEIRTQSGIIASRSAQKKSLKTTESCLMPVKEMMPRETCQLDRGLLGEIEYMLQEKIFHRYPSQLWLGTNMC